MAAPLHSFGWVKSQPDFRDRMYSPPAHILETALPPLVDMRAKCPPIEDQGSLGSCGPGAAAGLLQFDAMAQGLPNPVLPSRLFIYYTTRTVQGTVNQDSGVDNRSMMKAIAASGFCPESEWPYNIQQFRTKPSQQCYTDALPNRITDYLAVNQDLNTMRACLAGGKPFVFGFTVYESFESPMVQATGVVPMPTTAEQVLGGHDVLFVGYDDSQQRFILRNDWGPSWGVQGYGTIPYAYATNAQLSGDFWVVNTVPGGVSPPPPPPPGGLVNVHGLDANGLILWTAKVQ